MAIEQLQYKKRQEIEMARRSEHTQQQIKDMVLQAAETIVSEEGLDALKVRKIAMDIGYTVGSVYMVFDNMDDLCLHIKARTLDKLAYQLDLTESNADSLTVIRNLAKSYVQFAFLNYHLWEMIFIHRLPEGQQIPDWYQSKVENLFLRIESQLEQLTVNPRSQQEISLAAHALWSGIHGICILSLPSALDTDAVQKIESSVLLLVDCFLQGWMNSEA